MPGATPVNAWFFLSRVEVVAPGAAAAVVTFGDSITDGFNSTPNTNNRWPDHLARRLASAGRSMGVLNLGIDGNRVLADGLGVSALARFDRDVLAQPGVTHVVVLEGVNDLGLPALMTDGPRPSKEYDAVVDFDAVLKDPDHPARMAPPYDSGDHLHPSDAGYKAMADAVDVALRGATSVR